MAKDTKPKKEEVAPEPDKNIEGPQLDLMGLLNSPMAQSLLGGCKDALKKETSDPNICEITIRAPSEVVLRLFNIPDKK